MALKTRIPGNPIYYFRRFSLFPLKQDFISTGESRCKYPEAPVGLRTSLLPRHLYNNNDENNYIDLLPGDVIIIKGNRPHKALMIGKVVETDTFAPPRQDWIDGSDNYLRK